jgi:uncharacterized protein YgiM (DUF1202 family)
MKTLSRLKFLTRLFIAILSLVMAGASLAQDNFSYSRTAVINDPDGYTNIRKEASKKSPVIGKVKKGEKFRVAVTDGAWWPILTGSGLAGFIDSNRVKLLEPADDSGAPTQDPAKK